MKTLKNEVVMSSKSEPQKAEQTTKSQPENSRRAFLGKALKLAGVTGMTGALASKTRTAQALPLNVSESDLVFLPTTQLAAMIQAKKISSLEMTSLFIDRILKVDPILNAVVTPCFDRAIAEAKIADAALARGVVKGPLHGVPMTIKDSIDTEGVVTTGGTQGRSHFVPEKDASVVARLRSAGAILMGKTNTPEFTLGGVSGLGTTANILFGMTRNPHNPKYTVYGSSGGAGAIVAAGGSPFDIGSDFGGSVRSPSHACGIAGLKPTTGRVPRTGHIVGYGGAFDSYQQLGPMARYVEDLELILPIISGPDYLDAIIYDIPLGKTSSVSIPNLRVGYYMQQGQGAAGPAREVAATIESAVAALKRAGCSVREDTPPRIMEAMELRSELRNADGNAWQKRLTEHYGTIVPGPSRKFDLPQSEASKFTAMFAQQDSIKSDILKFMENYDVLITPVRSIPVPPIGDPDQIGALPGSSFTAIYNITGYPAGVVRGGHSDDGLPIGVQVVGQPWMEHVVLAVMKFLEQELEGYQRPNL